jgi:hypothetical protein
VRRHLRQRHCHLLLHMHCSRRQEVYLQCMKIIFIYGEKKRILRCFLRRVTAAARSCSRRQIRNSPKWAWSLSGRPHRAPTTPRATPGSQATLAGSPTKQALPFEAKSQLFELKCGSKQLVYLLILKSTKLNSWYSNLFIQNNNLHCT